MRIRKVYNIFLCVVVKFMFDAENEDEKSNTEEDDSEDEGEEESDEEQEVCVLNELQLYMDTFYRVG